ncbi:MAG TPA: hypothetical protein DDX98_09240 [Bacteroidales bacterium]|jgi:outer membrane protein assembly factor BamA|nr:hypothetical protein [Bacteroidales bacterium]
MRRSKKLKRGFIFIWVAISFAVLNVHAASNNSKIRLDSLLKNSKTLPAKTGYNLAPFPEFNIDPVSGIYLGVNATLYDYGTGEKYPNYNKLINLNAAWGTKGKTNISLRYKQYGAKNLSLKLSHSISNLYPFYGFNGYQTYYNSNYENPSSSEYITTAFFNYKQEKTEVDFHLQGKIGGLKLAWQAGFGFGYYNINRVDFEGLNQDVEETNIIVDAPTLYDRFVDWDIIKDEERNGGWANSFHTSLLYDTRDRLTNPTSGIWTQAILKVHPTFFGNLNNGLQLAIKHHQFYALIPNRISFAFRLRYDATFGNLSFYNRQVLADGIEGYGGASGMVGEGFGTLWGIHQNRVVGKQMALGNFEIRAKMAQFRLLKQNWHLALVPLFHTGVILQPYDLDLSSVSPEEQEQFFRNSYKGWYSSIGIGGKLVMNDNIAIGLDWANALNNEAGKSAIFVGFGYTF